MSRAQSLIRSLSLAGALALAFGCSSTGPAGQSGKGGTGQITGLGGDAVTGKGGAQAGGGSTGTGGTTASGTGGTTVTGVGGQAGQSSTGTGGLAMDGGYDGPNLGLGGGVSVTFGMTQCSDGIDNDGDGLIDYMDPECTGPLDNDEGTFATGIPGDNVDACKQDCFFDGNSGAGDDGCDWQLKCDPASTIPKCSYDSSYASKHQTECSTSASQSDQCINFCRQRTPNGCDCFGCCVVPGASTPIRLANTCTAKDFGDPTKCPVCTQVTQCLNPCERCEICIGKPTVPADCNGAPSDGGTPPPADGGTDAGAGIPQQCDFDAPSCGPQGQCDPGRGCVTGCCLVL